MREGKNLMTTVEMPTKFDRSKSWEREHPTVRPGTRLFRPNLQIDVLRHKLEQHGIIEVHDFLTVEWSRPLSSYLNQGMPRHWWTVAVRASREPEYYEDLPQNELAVGRA